MSDAHEIREDTPHMHHEEPMTIARAKAHALKRITECESGDLAEEWAKTYRMLCETEALESPKCASAPPNPTDVAVFLRNLAAKLSDSAFEANKRKAKILHGAVGVLAHQFIGIEHYPDDEWAHRFFTEVLTSRIHEMRRA